MSTSWTSTLNAEFHLIVLSAARKQGVGGLSFFSEDMHNTVLGTCEAADEAHNEAVEADRYGPDGQLLNPTPGIDYEEEA